MLRGRRRARPSVCRFHSSTIVNNTGVDKKSKMRTLGVVSHKGRSCSLVEWSLPESFSTLDDWLDHWKYGVAGSGRQDAESKFWRQRTVMAVQQKLEARCRPDFSGRESRPGEDTFEIFTLHLDGELTNPPLALALADRQPFPMGGYDALHIAQLVASPEVPQELVGAGAALVRALLPVASDAGQVLTVEPQSKNLEAYFSRLGFMHAPTVDRYLWFLADTGGSDAQPLVELRFVLGSRDDHDRLLAAFKRPASWISSSEEVFVTLREDYSRCNVMAIRMSRLETIARAEASARHFYRSGAGGAYKAGASEPVEVSDAMTVMRNPCMLDQLDWTTAQLLGASDGVGPRYVITGRCTIAQRAFPLAGVPGTGLEMVIDELELPVTAEPVFSVSVHAPLPGVDEVSSAVKSLLDKFGVRASFRPAPEAWNLEVVQSNGLVAAGLAPDEVAEEEDWEEFD
uniref:Uncharacterized protein n=1 Tax=Alexandrium catenella TaxID=2925 RepID=A0A7S1R9Y2_ALECA